MIDSLVRRLLERALIRVGHEIGLDAALAILQAEQELNLRKIASAGYLPKERHLRLVK